MQLSFYYESWFVSLFKPIDYLPNCRRRLEDFIQQLEKEVNIEFCRSMNRIVFDTLVKKNPKTYAFVTLPREPTKHYAESISEADRNAIYVNLPRLDEPITVKKGCRNISTPLRAITWYSHVFLILNIVDL